MTDRRILLIAAALAVGSLIAGALLASRASRVAAERDFRVEYARDTAFGDMVRRTALNDTLNSLAREAAGERGRVGIALRDVRTGAELHAGWPRAEDGQAFPMMSVYKVPIAVAVLAADAMGTLSLSDTVEFRPSDVRGFHSPLSERYPDGGVRLTVDELLEFAVSQSDNAASDRLLSLVGGPEGVSDRLRRLEVQGVRVDRPERELTFDLLGLEGEVRGREMNRAQWNALTSSVPDAQAASALDVFVEDERDSAEPGGIAEMFARLSTGRLLPPPHTARLLELMETAASQPPRLRGGVPAGTPVWSKTGTSTRSGGRIGAFNDVALIERPDGRRIVIALFVSGSEVEPERLAELAAAVASAALDG